MGFEFLSAFRGPYEGRDFASQIDARLAAQRRAQQELYAKELISQRLLEPKLDPAEATVAPLTIEEEAKIYRDKMLSESAGKEYAALDKLPMLSQVPMAYAPGKAPSDPVAPVAPTVQSLAPLGSIGLLSAIKPVASEQGASESRSAGQKFDTSTSEKTVAGAGTPQGDTVINKTLQLLTEAPKRDYYAEKMASGLQDLRQELVLDPSLNAGVVDPLISQRISDFSGAAGKAAEAQDKFRTTQLKEASDLWQAQERSSAQRDVADINASARSASDFARIASAKIAAGASSERTKAMIYGYTTRLRASLAQTDAFNQRTATVIPASATAAMLMGKPDLMNAINGVQSNLNMMSDGLAREGARLELLGGQVGTGDQSTQAQITNAGAVAAELDVLARKNAAYERAAALEEEKRSLWDKAAGLFQSNPKAASNPYLDRIQEITRKQNQEFVTFGGVQIPLPTKASFTVGSGDRTRSRAVGSAAPTASATPAQATPGKGLNTKGRVL